MWKWNGDNMVKYAIDYVNCALLMHCANEMGIMENEHTWSMCTIMRNDDMGITCVTNMRMMEMGIDQCGTLHVQANSEYCIMQYMGKNKSEMWIMP